MKLAIFVFGLCLTGCFAANNLYAMINKEVHVLLQADKALTVDHCTTKCDALFDLGDQHDEHQTDAMCQYACTCAIHPHAPVCHHNPHTTHAHMHHTTKAPVTKF